eukprot:470653_1
MSFHQNFSKDLWIGVLIFGVIIWLLCLFSLFYIIIQFKNIGSKKSLFNKKLIFWSLMSLIFFLIAQLMHHLYIIYVKLPSDKNVTKFAESIWGIFNLFWVFAYFSTYWLIYLRLNKVKALTKSTVIIFIVLLTCLLVSQSMISIVWFVFVFNKCDWETFNDTYTPLLVIKFIGDISLNCFIVYIHWSHIFKIRSLIPHECPTYSKVIDVMIKYFILTSATVLCTQIYTASEILLSISINHALKHKQFQFYYNTYIVEFTLMCIDSVISAVYIIFTFDFAKGSYVKFCNCLHMRCKSWWLDKEIKNKVDIKYTPCATVNYQMKSSDSEELQLQATNLSVLEGNSDGLTIQETKTDDPFNKSKSSIIQKNETNTMSSTKTSSIQHLNSHVCSWNHNTPLKTTNLSSVSNGNVNTSIIQDRKMDGSSSPKNKIRTSVIAVIGRFVSNIFLDENTNTKSSTTISMTNY